MQESKGISMISLIVTIIVTVLLASMAIGTGTRYLKESKKRDRETFISVLSNAVSQRREDSNVSSLAYPYLGYYIKDEAVFNEFASKVQTPIEFKNGIWYIVDTTTASGLGVKQSENYINTINKGSVENVTVALVNYVTGDVYLLDANASQIAGLDFNKENMTGTHEHRYLSEATCTEPKKCEDCGFILEEPLGHLYDPAGTATAIDENSHYYKTCKRCGMSGGYEPHKFEYIAYTEAGIWMHRLECPVCGYSKTPEACTLYYSLPDSEADKVAKHVVTCTKCNRPQELMNHNMQVREISESIHEHYCTLCSYLYAENHIDNNGDGKCDHCGTTIVDHEYPQLKTVTIKKKVDSDSEDQTMAKYGDTIIITIIADKKITKPEVTIGGQTVPAANITSTDGITWTVTYVLKTTPTIPNGELQFSINCKSDPAGIDLLAPVTAPTDGKKVFFDGLAPDVEYIPKADRA